MKATLTLFRERLSIFILFAIVASVVLSPLSSNTAIPDIVDYLNHIAAIAQAKIGLMDGQFPLRVMPLQNSGMSYPYYQFYSPTSHIIAGLVYRWITPSSPFIAFKFTIWCSLLCGGIFMYRVALWFVHSRSAALLAGAAYLTSPYFIIVVDHLGSFNEAIALGIFPAVLFYSIQYYYFPTQKKLFLKLSMGWFLLATVHVITFVYASIFTAVLFVFMTLKKPQHWLHLLAMGGTYLYGCLLATWFLAPVLVNLKYMNVNLLYGRLAGLDGSSSFLLTLISPAQNYKTATVESNGLFDAIHQFQPSLGLPILMGVGICLLVLFNKEKIDIRLPDFWLKPLLILFFLAFILVWSPLDLWHRLPHTLMVGQYSWRVLGQSIWIGAILMAWGLVWLFRNEMDYRHTILGLALILISASVWLPLHEGKYEILSIAEIKKNPILQFNPDTFLINTKKNKQLIDRVDSRAMDLTEMKNELEINTSYFFPDSIIKNSLTPKIILEGQIADNIPWKNKALEAVVNGKTVAKFDLNPGKFLWVVPLDFIRSDKTASNFSFLLKIDGVESKMKLRVNEMSVGGFLNPAATITLEQIKSNCQHHKDNMVCNIKLNDQIQLVELPILYYPGMLKISVNGKPVNYVGVLNKDILVAGVHGMPGIQNTIKMRFVGLPWANTVSLLAFFAWLAILMWALIEFMVIRKSNNIL